MILQILTYYLCIGLLFGIGHFLLVHKLFDKHPDRDNVNWQALFQSSLAHGILFWPADLFWISLTFLITIRLWFMRLVTPGKKEQRHPQD